MATYTELKELYQNRNQIKDKELIANINIDEFDKVPTEYAIPHDEFVKANSGLKGVMDYDKRNYTEPEDYRLCFQCNQAIARIDEVMPYLDKINESLEKRDVDIDSFKNSSSYSTRLLPLGDEILRARDAGVVEEYADYLCSEIAPRDIDAPHWMRETTEARRFLQTGHSLDQVEAFMEGNPDVRHSVSLFVRECENNQTSTDYMMKGVTVITKCKDMDSAFAISDTMTRAKFSPEAADAIRESYEMMMNTSDDKNPVIPAINERRFEVNHMISSAERYIGDITSFASEHQSVMDTHPELIKEMTQDFIDNGGTQSYISQYYYGEPDKLHDYVAPYYMSDVEKPSVEKSKAQPSGSIDNTKNHYMFYIGGGGSYANNTSDEIAKFGKEHFDSMKDMSLDEIKDKHIYWGSDEAIGYGLKGLYNGDTYVLFDDLEKLPKNMQHDALKMCAGLEEPKEPKQQKLETGKLTNAELSVKNISERTITNKDGKESTFYTGYVDVPKSVSQNGRAYITFNANQVADINVKDHDFANGDLKSATVSVSASNSRGARVMNSSGKYETKQTNGSELKKWNDEVSTERNKQIASVADKGSQIDSKNVEDQKGLTK